jgi:hypothetical protein
MRREEELMAEMVRLYSGQQRMVEALATKRAGETGAVPSETEAANHLMHLGWSVLCERDPSLKAVNLTARKKVPR